MKKSVKNLLRLLLLKFIEAGFIRPLVYFYSFVIKDISLKYSKGSTARTTLLAFHPEKFRGDLHVLAEGGEFRILLFPTKWLNKLLQLYWVDVTTSLKFVNYSNPKGNSELIECQGRIRKFLVTFIPPLYKKLNVDCIIGTSPVTTQEYDWAIVSERVGVPYIILMREALYLNVVHQQGLTDRFKRAGKFVGSHIIVHNETVREIIIKSKICDKERVSALGCLRMDKFLREKKRGEKMRPKVVLFSFTHGTGLHSLKIFMFSADRNFGFVNLFDHVHFSFAKLASENSEVDFLIKPKWGTKKSHNDRLKDEYSSLFMKKGMDLKRMPNLKIVGNDNVHDLILDSDVICGFGSTTLLEGAVAGKPVIFPLFDEALDPKYSEHVLFKDHLGVFDVAYTPAEFENKILDRVKNLEITPECMAERNSLFEKYVSSLKGNALELYTDQIQKVVMGPRRVNQPVL